MKTNFRNQTQKPAVRLLFMAASLLLFITASSSAFAAETRASQPQDALWQYMQSSSSFWDNIMKQIGSTNSSTNQTPGQTTPGTVTKPGSGTTTKPGTSDSTNNNNSNNNTNNNNTNNNASYAQQVLQLVNKERAAQGLSSLKLDAKISAAAQVRAAECAKSFSHTRPNGSSCFTALKEAGISYRRAAENLAYGQRTPAEVVQAWMNSSGHRANIMNPNYTTLGVGYTVINGTPYWSQFFIQ